MRYVKGLLWGAVGAIVTAMVWVLAVFIVPIFGPMLISRFTGSGSASGASISSDSVVVAAFVGFVCAFAWQMRK